MRKVVPDTNVLIDWLNEGRHRDVLFAPGVLKHLSAVVLLELEAGAFAPADQRLVAQLVKNFERAGRIVVPSAADYAEGGRLLRRLQAEHGYRLSKAHSLTNDVLIALSARRIGADVLTQNAKDFKAIAKHHAVEILLV